jgi:biotin transport system substrate-specific component
MQRVLAEKILPQRGILVDASLIVLSSLFVAAMAQLSIPLQPVPVTGQTFAVLLVGMVLGSRRGALALAAYLGEGLAGLPVFAEARFRSSHCTGTDRRLPRWFHRRCLAGRSIG